MRIFKIKSFTRFCRKEAIEDHDLIVALAGMTKGLTVANLGGDVFKLRVARKGEGKSGGFRTIVAVRLGHRALFLFGFAKSAQASLTEKELIAARAFALDGLAATDEQIELAVSEGRWTEVKNEQTKL